MAPPAAFNFAGIPGGVFSPSDSNGSVGNDQFVETVNVALQVWSLNRAIKSATPLLGPIAVGSLWSGFGGACEAQNSGDPVVLYDKLANRWLISQLTSSPSAGVYYQCVAISTTADATGSYHRYAFAVPNGNLGDYPHYGVWTDAYYMMAHAFALGPSGYSYRGAIFAALDRARMLQGDAAATWQVIEDPMEGGHMPADLDGFAPPPTEAPGIFLSLHSTGMHVYRMKVDFAAPANTTRSLQAVVPVAPSTAACVSGVACIPQPGTSQRLDSLGGVLMFRAAYRNLVDHETVVVSHSVDPSVQGVVSGVRWYDLRLSGTPDSICPAYPCLHQQGTIADLEFGRSRWMPSLAMDGAENLLVGYSTTGTSPGVENHSLRYTGRAKGDPLGIMTVPEVTIATGTGNNTDSERWGDYSSMSADPFDDCALWYVGQYYTASGSWATRIASASFPAGSGPGQCAPTSCTARPASAPTIGSAGVLGDNRVRLTWTGISPAPGAYAVERAEGACGSEGLYQPVGAVAGDQTGFTDTTVQGGITYAYRVRAASDGGGRCQTLTASACAQVTATGTCSLAPSFAGAESAASAGTPNCGIQVGWSPGTSRCPLTPNLRYNVFRGTVPDFVPSLAHRIATCEPGSSYLDGDGVASGVTYYYVVRAEDDSAGNGGACGGNAEANEVVVAGTAYGAGLQGAPGEWLDAGGDGTALLLLNPADPDNSPDRAWRIVSTSVDGGANHTPAGAYGYRNAGPAPIDTYGSNECIAVQTPPLTVGADGVNLKYWERHQLEYRWDGVVVEHSINGGPWFDVPPLSDDADAGCTAGDQTGGMAPLSCGNDGCGYPGFTLAYTGPGSGGSCASFVTGPLTDFARRCHPIVGLTAGDSVRFRWRFTSDSGVELAGFYLDDVAVSGVRLPNACIPDGCGAQPDGSPCDDGNPCTTGDSCAGGSCQAGNPVAPPGETTGLRLDHPLGTTLTWIAVPGSVVYDVAGATLADLRTGGTATAACLSNDGATASLVDGRPDPPSGHGWYYLVRAQGACGSGTYGSDSSSVERSLPAACP